jgi:hypothetical protein
MYCKVCYLYEEEIKVKILFNIGLISYFKSNELFNFTVTALLISETNFVFFFRIDKHVIYDV